MTIKDIYGNGNKYDLTPQSSDGAMCDPPEKLYTVILSHKTYQTRVKQLHFRPS